MAVIATERSPLVADPDQTQGRGDRRIGGILAQDGKLTAGDIERVLEFQRRSSLRFGEAALRLRLIGDEDLNCALGRQYDIPQLLPGSEKGSKELVAVHAPFHARAEEMRALRTQLLLRWSHAKVKRHMLAITSPGRGEGRSYLAANLAVVFSQLGERTLLIDADLRRPRQHRTFNIADRVGLSAVLSGRAGDEAVQPVSEFGSLALLPAGAPPPNPLELLSRGALGDFLKGARPGFDVVIFDTPPARLYGDAQSIAFQAGSAIVLARREHTRLEDSNGVIRDLSLAGALVAGTVLNAF
jgi:chain length determinant protein tyrosine kinase EpsG